MLNYGTGKWLANEGSRVTNMNIHLGVRYTGEENDPHSSER